MKKFITISLFFSFFNFNFGILFSEPNNELKSLNEIFSPYINIIEDHTNSDFFLKDWNNLEYLIFLTRLNTISALIKDIYYGDDKIYSNKKYQRDHFIKSISSIFTEIFGGIRLQSRIKDRDTYYIPEHLLDSANMLTYVDHPRKHDGALIRIDEYDLIIHKILEAKLREENYNLSQSFGVLQRWQTVGTYVSRKLFQPDNIKIGNSYTDIKSCSIEYFSNNIELYTGDNFQKDVKLDMDSLNDMSSDIFLSLNTKNTFTVLENINIQFIDRILFLLKKYIQVYHKIPSMLDDIPFFMTDYDEILSREDKLYYESWFSSNNDKNKKDLILSLYSIYGSNILYSFFQERISKFFNAEDIRNFYFSTKDKDTVTSMYVSKENVFDIMINTLVELLGQQYKEVIESQIRKNRIIILRGFVRNYNKALITKFNFLKEYFGEEDTRKLVLNNLKSFILIWHEKMVSNFQSIYSLFQTEKIDHLFYKFIYSYFDKFLNVDFSLLEDSIDFISKTFISNTDSSPRLKALMFILNNEDYKTLPSKIRKAIRESYKYFYDNRLQYFPSMSEDSFKKFCLDNINTLIYLDTDKVTTIVRVLRNTYKFDDHDIEKVLVNNIKHIHMIATGRLKEKIALIQNYLQKCDVYDSGYIKNIIITKLYNIASIHIEGFYAIVNILRNNLYYSYDYTRVLYHWIIEENHSFREISYYKLEKALKFLSYKLKDKRVIHGIIENINDPRCLNEHFLKFIFDNFKDSDRQFLINNLDRAFTVLNTVGYKKSIINLNKLEKNKSKKEQIEAFIRLNNGGCKNLFT